MYKNGVPLSEQRLCQPYGDDQRKGLDQFRSLEPGNLGKSALPGRGREFRQHLLPHQPSWEYKSEKPTA